MDSAGDLDRISALPDDLLQVILTFLRQATEVTRTAVLSRRWRRVWIGAQHLWFIDSDMEKGVAPGDFAGFVDWAIAQRGDTDIESLTVYMRQHDSATTEKVNEWIRYAVQHVVKSFDLYLPDSRLTADGTDRPPAVELPCHGRMTHLSLSLLGHRVLHLPTAAAARYEALTELKLYSALFDEEAPGASRTLGCFVSSCCPRLRKLYISSPKGLLRLVLRAEALEELRLFLATDLRTLDVTAPNLRVLSTAFCFHRRLPSFSGDEGVVDTVVRIAAPRLEEIGMGNLPYCRPDLDIFDPTSVRRLSDVHLLMHGRYYHDSWGDGLRFLENCPNVEHVDVWLNPAKNVTMDVLVDLTTKGPLANVRSMVLTAFYLAEHHFAASILSLLLRCPGLRSLCINILATQQGLCDDLNEWANHPKISLESLEEVKISGFIGADVEMDLVSLLFESSNAIKSMTIISAAAKMANDVSLKRIKADEDARDLTPIDRQLMKIPFTDRGRWHFEENVYAWTCNATKNAQAALSVQ